VASGGADGRLLLWDLAHGHLLADFAPPKETGAQVTAVAFSRCNSLISSADGNCALRLWDFGKFAGDRGYANVATGITPGAPLTVGGSTTGGAGGSGPGGDDDIVNAAHNPPVETKSAEYLAADWRSKDSPLVAVQFTRRNLLLAVGAYL